MKRWHKIVFVGLVVCLSGVAVYFMIDYRSLPPLSVSPHKVAHISFDDVTEVLKELKDKEARYESIFECDFLQQLRELHDDYGAKFSLYVYEKDGNFNIADMPVKFRKEFRTHSDWLKFGFHAIQPEFDRNIKFADFQVSFCNVYGAICRFADSTSLSPVLRLHYYYGNDSIITFINNCREIQGLLCADDDRDSYDLNKNENHLLQQRFYLEKGLKYFKTDLRYEKAGCVRHRLTHLRNRDTLVLFTHEWAYIPLTLRQTLGYLVHQRTFPPNWFTGYKLRKSIKWLKDCGYEFSFLE